MAADLPRCWWADTDPLLADYHDQDWGKEVTDDKGLFEMLTLEGAQAGLSWLTILRKREGYRNAFYGFDPDVVARFDDTDRSRLLADAGIVRNRLKVDSTINNAQAVLAVIEQEGSFHAYLRRLIPTTQILPPDITVEQLTATTPDSDRLSKDLKQRGFRFVGSTVVYSFMESVGLVDDHMPNCFLYKG